MEQNFTVRFWEQNLQQKDKILKDGENKGVFLLQILHGFKFVKFNLKVCVIALL